MLKYTYKFLIDKEATNRTAIVDGYEDTPEKIIEMVKETNGMIWLIINDSKFYSVGDIIKIRKDIITKI